MTKIPFDIKFKPQIESGEYKVETFSGYPVTIYRWDFYDGAQTPIMGTYVFEDGKEYVGAWNDEGHFEIASPNDLDLFIITPEPELTSWQTFISGCLQKYGLLDCGAADRIAKECSAELLELARKELEPEVLERLEAAYKNQDEVVYENGKRDGKAEALKDLPRWYKCAPRDIDDDTPPAWIVRFEAEREGNESKIVHNGYYIDFGSLERLPGFNE